MVTPEGIHPEASQEASQEASSGQPVGAPNLETLTPHPEEFQSLSAEVIGELQSHKAESNRAHSAPSQGNWLQRFGLKTKVRLGALALGTLPVLVIGGLSFTLAEQSFEQKIRVTEQARAEELADKVNRFMFERFADIKDLSKLPTFTDPMVRDVISQANKNEVLRVLVEDTGAYDSVAVFDLAGNPIAQSDGGEALSNHADRDYFQAVLTTNQAFISQPTVSETTGQQSVFLAAPVLDRISQKPIAIVRSRMPVSILDPLVEPFSVGGEEYHLADSSNIIFESAFEEELGVKLEEEFPVIEPFADKQEPGNQFGYNTILEKEELITFAPFESLAGMPDMNWSATISLDKAIVLEPQRRLLLALGISTNVLAIIIGLLSTVIANRATRPLLAASDAVKRIGSGDLDVALDVPEQGDELVQLGNSINLMGRQLQSFLFAQESEARLASKMANIARLQSAAEMVQPLDDILHEVQRQMGGDRVLFQRVDSSDGSGSVIAEAVLPQLRSAQGQALSALSPAQLSQFRDEQQPQVYSAVAAAGFPTDLLNQLQSLSVQSMLCAPLFANNELYGLLTVQACQSRSWTEEEAGQLAQLANRLSLSINAVDSFEQTQESARKERAQKEVLQKELLNLLSDVEGASSGDLTVRAQITDGEIGIVADFFNAIVENLRDIVTQVKQASGQVNSSVSDNGASIRQLSQETYDQAGKINITLESIEEMTTALQSVAAQASQAAQASKTAEVTAQAGGQAMETTVSSISQVRETVAETAKKVKRLGESSQQISKVVELINQIALKTNLLAVNAGIEAARAGEEGRGFAVVAEEVGALAAQSAVATKEIEQIITAIQTETGDVVEAMETSTAQVVEGTRSVEEAKRSLAEILEVSRQVNNTFQLISSETSSQAATSETVKQLMTQVAQESTEASEASREVSESLQDTVQITEQLQRSVDAFKISDAS